jgi:glycine/D-amino acid oxidase-like deaminating enzyme/nitrite reductase/ring-hydroxylating ferredoxin subunit
MARSFDESIPVWKENARSAESSDGPVRNAMPLASTQVCVVGAGISGLTTAYLLQRAGFAVQVIDTYGVAAGESGRTTAHLTAVLDDRFFELERLLGGANARLAADSHRAAIDCVEEIVASEHIDCDFERLDGYLVCPSGALIKDFERESEAVRRAGFSDAQNEDSMRSLDLSIDGPALRFPRQAAFHATRYLRGLARAFTQHGGTLVPGMRAVSVSGGRNAHVELANGKALEAEHIVVATNTPFNDRVLLHTKQAAYRTYVVGFQVEKDSFPAILLWDLEDPYHYVRRVRGVDRDVVIVGGEDHKTGQANDATRRYGHLETWARSRFPGLGEVRYRWSGQIMEPVDSLAFIGRNPLDDDNVYIVTGDSGNGLTHGTLAGMLLGDLIAGRASPWEKLYDPARKSLKSATTYVGENANAAKRMVKDWAKGGEVKERDDIPRGEGAIVRDGMTTLAVYRDTDGSLQEVSAVCTHLGCIVQWNGSEKSWDCPCHGSRFTTAGAILNGPAAAPLKPASPEDSPPAVGVTDQPAA